MAVFVINIMIFNNESNFLLKLVFLNTTIHKDIVFATAILLVLFLLVLAHGCLHSERVVRVAE
jgi:hypothetical protein